MPRPERAVSAVCSATLLRPGISFGCDDGELIPRDAWFEMNAANAPAAGGIPDGDSVEHVRERHVRNVFGLCP